MLNRFKVNRRLLRARGSGYGATVARLTADQRVSGSNPGQPFCSMVWARGQDALVPAFR